MADKREQILSRLVEIAEGITGVQTVLRNQMMQDDIARPTIIILDADEQGADNDQPAPGRTAPPGATRVALTPEIYIMLGTVPEDLGTAINVYRARFYKAVMTDSTLLSITQANGIKYEAFVTGLARGRSMEGEGGISFTFTYILKASDLEGI